MSDPAARMKELRQRMDEITLAMMRLLRERIDTSTRIGELKRLHNIPIIDEAREDEIRKMAMETADREGIARDVAARFVNRLLNKSAALQSEDSPTHLAIFARAKAMEQEGHSIIHMEVGEPDFEPPQAAGRALLEGFRAGHTKYGLPAGDARLRDALAEDIHRRYGVTSSAEGIMVTPGARFAVFAGITTLLYPGDEIMLIEPAWPAYREAAIYHGVKPRIIHTTLEGGWEPSMEDLERAVAPQTKMIVLSYPSNPTGKILPRRLLDNIMDFAARHDLYVLSDEIYRDYTMRGNYRSVLEYSYPKSIVTQSFSKSHALMGFRIGYAAAAPDTIRRMTAASALCLTGVAGVIQYAALKSLRYDTTPNVEIMRERLGIISKGARQAGLEFAEPDGAMYVFARVPGADGMDVVERCLERGLALAPGSGFGHYPEFVRISAGTGQVESGMNILYDTMREHAWKR
ncbi:MAG: aminotransferase class I/II-fold pyridoxal phosphate-dependent enzyme [Thaumarchaeota archaeon]|nr:aminotransferase class I/II-fold pyridoxal phosphate-dependent enzyme [Nitrososphaerota archaeon]